MTRSPFAISVLALLSAGCAGMSAALEYSDVLMVPFEHGDSEWRIYDKPTEGRVMITPTIGRAMGMGALSGLTLGAADTDIPKPEYQRAVEGWLAQTGRTCAVLDGYKLIRPQWEFKYRC